MIGLAFKFVLANWMPFAFGGILLVVFTYHRCAVSSARETGRQEGQVQVREVIALDEDANIRLLAEREEALNERAKVQQVALDNQAMALEQAQVNFLKMQTDFHLTQSRSLRAFERRLQDAGKQAIEVPRADLIPVWDTLLAEHRRRDAAEDPRNHTGTQ